VEKTTSTIAADDASIKRLTRTVMHKVEATPAARPVVTVPSPAVQ